MALIGDLNPRLLKYKCFDVKTRQLEPTEASSKTIDNTIEKIIKRRKIIRPGDNNCMRRLLRELRPEKKDKGG